MCSLLIAHTISSYHDDEDHKEELLYNKFNSQGERGGSMYLRGQDPQDYVQKFEAAFTNHNQKATSKQSPFVLVRI